MWLQTLTLAILTFCAVLNIDWHTSTNESLRQNLLLIGITTDQEHFEHRDSLRETWLQLIDNPNIKYRFLIGKEICDIPPNDRSPHFSCQEQYSHSVVNESVEIELSTISISNRTRELKSYQGFSFIVGHHGITVYRFGITRRVVEMADRTNPVRVVLYNGATQHRVCSVTFLQDTLDRKSGGILWKQVQAVELPAGFEGELVMEPAASGLCNGEISWNHGGGYISLRHLIEDNNSREKFSNDTCPMVGFVFTANIAEDIEKGISKRWQRKEEWHKYSGGLAKKLQLESNAKADILFLDMIDVYNNLPKKMLLFFKWAADNDDSAFVMKTDDDVFVDIVRVAKELKARQVEWDWWSCFREGWSVPRTGKWRDDSYPPKKYPSCTAMAYLTKPAQNIELGRQLARFPSGAGYVLKRNVMQSIVGKWKNSELNVDGRGEDVALGLWLEQLQSVSHIGMDCYWACDHHCHGSMCNAAELSVSEMYAMWQDYHTMCNGSICNCPP